MAGEGDSEPRKVMEDGGGGSSRLVASLPPTRLEAGG